MNNPIKDSDSDPAVLFSGRLVIPVIRIASADRAVELAQTLVNAGLSMLEITLRTPAAIEAIERIANEVPDAVVGAGTVLSAGDLERAQKAGARFAIAPGCTETLYRESSQSPVPLIAGVATVSEVMLGMEHGHDCFKFFPAEPAGGPAMLRAWAGPLPRIRFVPTGGITIDNAAAYLALDNVLAVGGSWMVPDDAIASGDWTRIARLARDCSRLKGHR